MEENITDLKLWQKRVITLYEKAVCDLSFDHVSVEITHGGFKRVHEFHELGYETCPACQNIAPIINLTISRPFALIKMCDCGYEAPIERPTLCRNLLRVH
jgi:hypothetical protein